MLGQKRGQILEKTRAQFGAKFHEKKKKSRSGSKCVMLGQKLGR